MTLAEPGSLSADGVLVPHEPVFLSDDAVYRLRTFVGDFVNFTSTVAYYPLLATVGVAAHVSDNAFRTRLFDRFVSAVERFDHGKESVIDRVDT
ncbi:hypothetical protein GCM10007304_17240 [Rhodococcoides trifolii]|uniref:Uncharacterized protein n=1 Tax=Rhodococcoides trifolii TaxID=908250 RepID=A0A917CZL3_9NOCA|nr:hypothetical protein [Rhodococcus trifolii]GGG03685.1 hypothetical protein GCM10007304_17240 [Rhodococcus trifolii]